MAAGGIYFVRMTAAPVNGKSEFVSSRRIILVR